MKAIIKEACDRTIEAETLAKERLGELNNKLSVHCRIPVCISFQDRSNISYVISNYKWQLFNFIFIQAKFCVYHEVAAHKQVSNWYSSNSGLAAAQGNFCS